MFITCPFIISYFESDSLVFRRFLCLKPFLYALGIQFWEILALQAWFMVTYYIRKEGARNCNTITPLSQIFHYTQAPKSLHLYSILHPPPSYFIPQRPSTKFHPFLNCPSSLSTFNHQFHGIHIH